MKNILAFIVLLLIILSGWYIFTQKYNYKYAGMLVKPAEIINKITPLRVQKPNQSSYFHIAIIVMENRSLQNITGNINALFINSLIKQGTLLSNYSAVTHPSLPNYLAILGGDTFGITSDCQTCFISANNLVDQLENYHKTWKAYMESMPANCFLGSTNLYAQKHNPFIYFNDIRENKNRCNNVVPLDNLKTDLSAEKTTPDFIWITPNICNDMHDCSTLQGDKWLSKEVPLILNSPAFTTRKSLLIITWDEAEGSDSNKVPTIIMGTGIKHGLTAGSPYNHYSLLHTIEKLWGMPPINSNAKKSAIINEILL